MKINKLLFVLISFFIIAFQCTDIENPDAPLAPQIVEKSKPGNFYETGINPVGSTDAISIQWEANSEEDLAGYKIYRAADTSSNQELDFSKIHTASVNFVSPIATATEYIDYDVSLKIKYFYYLTAFNQSDNESEHSDTVSYQLSAKPSIYCPDFESILCSDAYSVPGMRFRYSDDIFYGISRFIIKVADMNNDSIWCYSVAREQYDGSAQTVVYNIDGSSVIDSLTPGQFYKWKVKAITPTGNNMPETEGAETDWVQFKIREN
ncbi:MAG: hypothetical protein U9N76_08575 [Candidatus Marinimicrobia bacterium]|nr:hypothetical protein [Candidatus Neomarinimicrobiota bacterium]